MLDIMKQLLGIEGSDKDFVLQHYLSKSENIIKGYCGIDDILEQYECTIIDYAIYLYRNRDAEGITSQSQGSRSATFTHDIPETIKTALPKPRVKVVG